MLDLKKKKWQKPIFSLTIAIFHKVIFLFTIHLNKKVEKTHEHKLQTHLTL